MKNKGFSLLVAVILFVVAVYVLTTPTITGFLTRTGEFSLGNELINVTALYINGTACSSEWDQGADCTVNPTENTTTAAVITVTVRDYNGNCDEFLYNNGTAYICSVTEVPDYCNSTSAHAITDLEYNGEQWGDSNEFCNLTGTATNFQFYELYDDYWINLTVTDGVSTNESYWFMYYNQLIALQYPETGTTINMGSLALSAWNDGKGYHWAQNSGNSILELDWNATDFQGINYADNFTIDGANFLIDDDNNSTDDTGSMASGNISATETQTIYYEPATGLLKCSLPACTNENATMDVYWHLLLPSGLHADTYRDTIEVTVDEWTSYRVPGTRPGGGEV